MPSLENWDVGWVKDLLWLTNSTHTSSIKDLSNEQHNCLNKGHFLTFTSDGTNAFVTFKQRTKWLLPMCPSFRGSSTVLYNMCVQCPRIIAKVWSTLLC